MPNNKNIEIIKNLREKIKKAHSIVLTETKGLSASNIADLRKSVRESDAEVAVAKNTLLKIALKEESIDVSDLKTDLKGQTTAIFTYTEPVAVIKKIIEFAKGLELPRIKSAIIDKKYSNAEQVEILSKLPSRIELIGQVLGGLKAPINGFHNVLSGTQRKFMYALTAVAGKKQESN